MRNIFQSIVLMLAGVGVYFVIQILFFPQPDQQLAGVADLTRELSDIKQVIARISEEPSPKNPVNTARQITLPTQKISLQDPASTFDLKTPVHRAKPKPRPASTEIKTALGTKTQTPSTTNPFNDDLSKAQLLAAIVRAVKAQTDDSIAAPVPPQGVGVEVHVVQGTGDSVSHYFYTIQKGDSLRSIARNFYGDPTKFMRIYEANKRLLPNANQIQVGQRLRIPPKG